MNRFARLLADLDATTRTSDKTAALAAYFRATPEPDRIRAIALLSGRSPRRSVTSAELRAWGAEVAAIPPWLFEESYAATGDLAETLAHLLPLPVAPQSLGLAAAMDRLASLAGQPVEARQAAVLDLWAVLPPEERFVFNKLLTGGFRAGVAQGLVIRALAEVTGLEPATLAHRLTGQWNPATTTLEELIAGRDDAAQPYPFALAHALEGAPETLGPATDWAVEWKWDGIRAQAIRRAGQWHLWSRGEEMMTARFPDLAILSRLVPDGTVIDGEIVVWDRAAALPRPFAALQPRIGRKTVPARLLAEAPARLIAYDLMEWGGQDIRAQPFASRRRLLDDLCAALPPGAPMQGSPLLAAPDWAAVAATRNTAREAQAEGLMLKRLAAPYATGRKRGDWWKWKLDPMTVDAVMVYAQAGHGRRAGLYTDFTLALRDGEALVPVARAYSGLTDAEFAEISAWVRAHTLERFGPVRRVPPTLVFEIGFEAVQASPRHKSGIAVRFPRLIRWRRDKTPDQIDTLDALRALASG